MTRTQLRPPDPLRPRHYRENLLLRPLLDKIESERIPNPSDQRPDPVVSTDRTVKLQTQLRLFTRSQPRQRTTRSSLQFYHAREILLDLHVSERYAGLVRDIDHDGNVLVTKTVRGIHPMACLKLHLFRQPPEVCKEEQRGERKDHSGELKVFEKEPKN